MRRVFYIFVIFIFISFMVIGCILNYLAYSFIDQATEAKVKRDLGILATTTQGALANNDYERVEEQVFLWGELEPRIVSFEVVLDGDIEIVKYAREIQTSNVLALAKTISLPSGRIIIFCIKYDLSENDRQATIIAVSFLSMSSCIAVIFIFLLWRILQRLAFIPLNREITERKRVEKALLESELYFRDFFENAPIGFHIFDSNQTIIDVNDSELEMIGYSRDEIVDKKTWADLIVPAQREQFKKHWHDIATTGKVTNLEYKLVHKEGHYIDVILNASSRIDANGKIINTRGSIINVTERKRAEEKLRHFQKAVSSSSDAIGISAPDGRHYYQNQAFTELFGMAVEEIDGMSGPPSTVYVDEQFGREVFETLIRGESWTGEVEMVAKDSRKLSVLLRAYPIKDEDGKIIGLVGVHTDITERKRARKAIQDSEKRLRSIADYTYDWESWFAPDGQLMWVNPAVEKLTGYSVDECRKMSDYPLPIVHEDDRLEFRNRLRQALAEQSSINNAEFRISHKKGSVDWMAISWQPIYDDKGKHIGQRTSVRDITERKEAEVEREKLVRKLEYKNRELQDIVYTASHDLRSPLVNIEGFSGELEFDCDRLIELLVEQAAGVDKSEQIEPLIKDDIPQSIRFIISGAKKMSSLLDGLLQISRIGIVEIHSESLDMEKAVQGILDAMEHQIKVSNITVTVDSLPRCIADTHMLDHVFTNLISNAIKYRDPVKESNIKISGMAEGGMSIYCIEDNGVGIAPAHQKKVFEIFHRLNPEDSVCGEGLGLTIVTRILDRLGGEIRLESELGKGSKFFISLPTA